MVTRASKIAVIASLSLMVAGCAGASTDSGNGDDGGVITIGVAVSDTGAYSAEGQSVRHGYEFWEKRVKEAGGIEVDGIKRDVDVVYYDDQSKPETAIKLTQRLISEDEVDFLFGPYSSGLTLATSSIAQQYKKIMFAGAGSAAAIFEKKNPYVFSPLSATSQYPVAALDTLAGEGVKSVGILHTDEAPMVEGTEVAEDYAEKVGIHVVATQSVAADSKDIRGAMRQIRAASPDAFLAFGTTPLGVLAVRTMRDIDWSLPTVVSPAAAEDAFGKTLGAAAEGVIAPSQWEPVLAFEDDFFGSAKDFAEDFEAEFGEGPTYLSASGAAAAYSLQLAVEEAGTTETEAVREALYAMDADTFFGRIAFADMDDPSGLPGSNVDRPMVVIQLNDEGQRTVVGPEDVAEAEVAPFKSWSAR